MYPYTKPICVDRLLHSMRYWQARPSCAEIRHSYKIYCRLQDSHLAWERRAEERWRAALGQDSWAPFCSLGPGSVVAAGQQDCTTPALRTPLQQGRGEQSGVNLGTPTAVALLPVDGTPTLVWHWHCCPDLLLCDLLRALKACCCPNYVLMVVPVWSGPSLQSVSPVFPYPFVLLSFWKTW